MNDGFLEAGIRLLCLWREEDNKCFVKIGNWSKIFALLNCGDWAFDLGFYGSNVLSENGRWMVF